jgi:peptidoglycan/xylan/chitin deacetylase (PgdA/CDA1 family)
MMSVRSTAESIPVVFGICLDAEAIWVGRQADNADRPVLLSHGAFAVKEGLSRLLDLLDMHGVCATFFVPGMTADRYPDAVRDIHHCGHELGSHGYGHRPIAQLSADEEKTELVRGIDALEKIVGYRPLTWRSPSWEWSERTFDLLLEAGVSVSANFHDRVRPYRHERDGKPLPLVELPVQWHLADAPYFMYGGQIGRAIRSARAAQEIWQEEFDGLCAWPGAFFHLTLHVQLIGHPGRLRMLDRFIRHIKQQKNAVFMCCRDLAGTVP